MLQRPILHLPKKSKLQPQSIPVLQSLATDLTGDWAKPRIQGSTNPESGHPPNLGPPQIPAIDAPQPSRRERRHRPGVVDLSQPGFLRLEQVLAIFPVSRASWYAGLGTIYPNSVRIGPRSVAWRTEDIRALVSNPPAFIRG